MAAFAPFRSKKRSKRRSKVVEEAGVRLRFQLLPELQPLDRLQSMARAMDREVAISRTRNGLQKGY